MHRSGIECGDIEHSNAPPHYTGRTATSHQQDRRLGRWALLGGGGVFAALLVVQASLVEAAYPALILAAGVLLYRHYPVHYVGYAWWVVFLTPEVRRLVDYQSGWSEISPIMLAPMLVAGLPALNLVRPSAGAWGDRQMLPFWLILAGVACGYAVGVVRTGLFAATYGALTWGVPIFFGMHVMHIGRTRFVRLREVLVRTFVGGVLVMGSYGVIQFFLIPPWDGFWMVNSGMGSIGVPEPGMVRVFSTLNSPGPFASVLMAGLLVLFAARSRLVLPAALAGYAAFLLSLVRTAWLGWGVGALLLLGQASQRQRRRLTLALAGALVGVVALTLFSPMGETVSSGLQSLTNISSDTSFKERMAFMDNVQNVILAEPIGQGIGNAGTSTKLSDGSATTFDSGLFRVPYALGWVGALAYGGGILLLMWRGWTASWGHADPFVVVSFAIAVAMAAQMLSGHTLSGEPGLAFWAFLGVVLARSSSRAPTGALPPSNPYAPTRPTRRART